MTAVILNRKLCLSGRNSGVTSVDAGTGGVGDGGRDGFDKVEGVEGKRGVEEEEKECIAIEKTHSYFGTHDGVVGALAEDGSLLLVERGENGSMARLRVAHGGEDDGACGMEKIGTEQRGRRRRRLGLVAMAGNESLVGVPLECCPGGTTVLNEDNERKSGLSSIEIVSFTEVDDLISWATGHTERRSIKRRLLINTPEKYATMETSLVPSEQPTAVQLVATATSFAILLSNGSVYTWGDARYPATLGREAGHKNTDDSIRPAHVPGLVTALGGLHVVKVVGRGWYLAALTGDKEVYFWGGRPGEDRLFRDIAGLGRGSGEDDDSMREGSEAGEGEEKEEEVSIAEDDVVLLRVNGMEDILDVDVGCSHLVILACMESGERRVMGIGMDENGQLGSGRTVSWASRFVTLDGFGDVWNVVGVRCSDYGSFVLVGDKVEDAMMR